MFSGLMVSNRTLPNRILSRTPICKITTINAVPPKAAFHLFLPQTFWDRVVGPHGFETQFEKHLLGHYKGWSALIRFDEADIQEQAMFIDDQAWFSEPRHMTVLGQTRREGSYTLSLPSLTKSLVEIIMLHLADNVNSFGKIMSINARFCGELRRGEKWSYK